MLQKSRCKCKIGRELCSNCFKPLLALVWGILYRFHKPTDMDHEKLSSACRGSYIFTWNTLSWDIELWVGLSCWQKIIWMRQPAQTPSMGFTASIKANRSGCRIFYQHHRPTWTTLCDPSTFSQYWISMLQNSRKKWKIGRELCWNRFRALLALVGGVLNRFNRFTGRDNILLRYKCRSEFRLWVYFGRWSNHANGRKFSTVRMREYDLSMQMTRYDHKERSCAILALLYTFFWIISRFECNITCSGAKSPIFSTSLTEASMWGKKSPKLSTAENLSIWVHSVSFAQ